MKHPGANTTGRGTGASGRDATVGMSEQVKISMSIPPTDGSAMPEWLRAAPNLEDSSPKL